MFVIRDSDIEHREWVMKITDFIVYGPVCGHYRLFVDGEYFVARSNGGTTEVDSWTEQPKMVARNFELLHVQPMCLVSRKVMLYPNPLNKSCPSFYLVVDLSTITSKPVVVPYYTKLGEVVKITGSSKPIVVQTIDKRRFCGRSLKWIGGSNPRWIVSLTLYVY